MWRSPSVALLSCYKRCAVASVWPHPDHNPSLCLFIRGMIGKKSKRRQLPWENHEPASNAVLFYIFPTERPEYWQVRYFSWEMVCPQNIGASPKSARCILWRANHKLKLRYGGHWAQLAFCTDIPKSKRFGEQAIYPFLSFVIFGNDISDLLCWVISYEKVTNIAPPKIDFLSTVIIIGLYSLKDDDSQFWAVGDLFWVLGDYFGFGGTKETKIPNLHTGPCCDVLIKVFGTSCKQVCVYRQISCKYAKCRGAHLSHGWGVTFRKKTLEMRFPLIPRRDDEMSSSPFQTCTCPYVLPPCPLWASFGAIAPILFLIAFTSPDPQIEGCRQPSAGWV